uniref:Protein lethal(2)essential for life (inferred by orthology to a D. melanogaster protein) n=1 Tax=Strongyloides venezuelensis TaxID=75913 RepID=A0A0K0EW33_STRVS
MLFDNRMMRPYYSRVPLSYCPYRGRYVNEWDHAMERHMANTMSWANKSLTDTHKFAETSPEVVNNDMEFKVRMDVSHFSPDELHVSVNDGFLQIEGNHEEKTDKYGTIQRNFVRKYTLPKGMDEDNIVSEISKNGVLTVGGTKGNFAKKGKNVPITFKH